jgi:hypothetical protein
MLRCGARGVAQAGEKPGFLRGNEDSFFIFGWEGGARKRARMRKVAGWAGGE